MNNKLINSDNEINNIFDNIKELVINSRNRVYATVNTEMLNLYCNIGKTIMLGIFPLRYKFIKLTAPIILPEISDKIVALLLSL